MPNQRSLSDSERIQCQFFLQNHPLFASLEHKVIIEISCLFSVNEFVTDDVIVTEDDPVDSIFFIADGFAMVGRSFSQISSIYIAELQSGQAIGLSENGLFSKTMKRTATIVAKSDLKAFRLDLNKFEKFLAVQPTTNRIIHINSELFSRIKFINEIAELKGLILHSSLNLVDKVQELTLPANNLLEQDRDWYLLQSGRIEIHLKAEGENSSAIAVLTPPALVLPDVTRKPNVIVKTVENCDFLKISEANFSHASVQQKHQITKEQNTEIFQYTKDGWIAF